MTVTEKLQLYKEYPQPHEEETAQRIITLMQTEMLKTAPTGRTLRDVHSKTHSCVRAEFKVLPNLPQELRVGVFKEPRTFPACIRFSNAGALAPVGGTTKDIRRDARGMAVKIFGADGEKLLEDEKHGTTHDFLLFTPPNFFSPTAQGFFDLMSALTTSRVALAWYVITHPKTLFALLLALRKHANVLDQRYFSAVPYRFGEKAVKYSASPRSTSGATVPRDPSPNFLGERLQQQLAAEEVHFDFMVQFQTDPNAMPIENGIAIWNERVSPFVKVAAIRIGRQQCGSPAQMEFCDNLSFSPWRSIPEHRPLGNISRTRRLVYASISKFRHTRNSVPRQEPTVDEMTRVFPQG